MIYSVLHKVIVKRASLVLFICYLLCACHVHASIIGTAYFKVHVDNKGNARSVKLLRGVDKELDDQSIALCKSLAGLDVSVRGKDIIVPVSYYGMCQNGAMTVTKDRILLDDLRLVGGVKCARNVPPQLRGGDDRALKKALDERERVVVDGVEGAVEACFYVNGLGRVTDVVIMKSLNHILDKEVVGLCKSFDFIAARNSEGGTNGAWMRLTVNYSNGGVDAEARLTLEEYTSCNGKIYAIASKMPKYENGEAALMRSINNNLRYPSICGEIQGTVVVRFEVTPMGEIGEVEVVRSLERNLDEEAIRAVKMIDGYFQPAINAKGKPVSCWYFLPVTFKLVADD
ncbi:MAG: TonB family protein [Muribaculaceae bacterium]|nr:TonB family protein [Muribaculaceae bacterium]